MNPRIRREGEKQAAGTKGWKAGRWEGCGCRITRGQLFPSSSQLEVLRENLHSYFIEVPREAEKGKLLKRNEPQ